MDFSITVYLPSGLVESGILSYSKEGIHIKLDNGKILNSDNYNDGTMFSLDSKSRGLPAGNNERIVFKPFSTIKKYSSSEIQMNEMYPKSTGGWITRLSDSGKNAVFVTHPIENIEKKLLLIFDPQYDNLLEGQIVHPYETTILQMELDWDAHKRLYREQDFENRDSLINSILDSPPPDWNDLAKIVEGITVPNLKIKETMRDTMSQLIPLSFPSNIRDELMAFLSLIIYLEIPDEDPLTINSKYRTTPILHSLLFYHIQCLIQGDIPPEYVRVFIMADRGLLPVATHPVAESIEMNPWDIAWYKLTSMFPDRRGRIIKSVAKLYEDKKIITSIPISKSDAVKSKEAWIDRFAMILYSLNIRGHIQNRKLGLRTLVYVGGAHRWPHNHLAMTARLGNPVEKPPYIQVMVMPPSATERVRRLRTNIAEIVWSASTFNYHLFNESIKRWKVNTSRILQSVEGQRNLKQLEREFDTKSTGKIYSPTYEDARVLGFTMWSMYLNSLELGEYEKLLGMNTVQLREILTHLVQEGVIHLQYYLYTTGLASVCFVCKGPTEKIQSLTRSLLKHTPSTTARLAEKGKQSFILSRLPEESIYEISTQLPLTAEKSGVEVKIYRVSAYAAYTHNLYSRLLKPDGTWDDDISALLSQIRS